MVDREEDVDKLDVDNLVAPLGKMVPNEPCTTRTEASASTETTSSLTTGSIHAFFADSALPSVIKKPQRRGSMAGTGTECCGSLPCDTEKKLTTACSRRLSATTSEFPDPCGRSRGVDPTVSPFSLHSTSISALTGSTSTLFNDSSYLDEYGTRLDLTPRDTMESSIRPQRRVSLVSELTDSYNTLPHVDLDCGSEVLTLDSPARRPKVGRMCSQISELGESCCTFEEMDQWSQVSPRRYGKSLHLISSISEMGVSLVSDEGGMENFFKESIETPCKNYMPQRRASIGTNCSSPKAQRRRGSMGTTFKVVKGKASAPRIPRRRSSLDMT